jgi:sorting nexin-25
MHLDRKYVIAAGLVGFVSWAYLTDWIPSLRWVPYAFAAGVLTTVAVLLFLFLTTSKGVRYRDDGPQNGVLVKPAFTSAKAWEEEKAALQSRAEYRRPIIFPEAIAFSRAVDGLLDLILRDYVTSWYTRISQRPLFQHEVDRTIRSVLLTVVARITNFDLVEIGVANILPMVTAHMKDFYHAERAVRGKDLSHNVTESEELHMAIAGKFRNGNVHAVASLANSDTTSAQQQHLRSLVTSLLPILLPDNMKSSPAVTVVIREIVTCAVLAPILRVLAEPDTVNQLIVNIGGPMLQDRKAVRKVRAALEQNAPASPKVAKGTQFPRLRPYDSERQFERFIRAIRHVSTLSDARRLRSEIMSQLRRDSAVEGQDAAYLRRLETGKRLLDQKIATLSADSATKPKLSVQLPTKNGEASSRKRQASLREVLYDASGLSYFMEYMDRLKLMRLVQFYIVVDGFRGPLEGDHDELGPGMASDPERMDIVQMYEGYLSKPELQTPESALQTVKSFLKAGVDASAQDYIDARQAVLQTQTQVYNTMSKVNYENFKRSDLYYKWLAIDDIPAFTALQNKQIGASPSPNGLESWETSPSKPRKPQLLGVGKQPELRRAVLSSSNLKDSVKAATAAEPRRSLDDSSRPALFDDDVDDDRMIQSLTSLKSQDSDSEATQHARDEAKAVNAMKLALDDIVGEEDKDSLFSDSTSRQSFEVRPAHGSSDQLKSANSARSSLEQNRPPISARSSELGRPNISSLGLVGAPSSRGVFVDDLFGDEAQKFAEDEREQSDAATQSDEDQVQEAAPGDLGLLEAIDALNADVEKLTAQKQIVDSLTAKAELTNNAAELRILKKSEQSLQREIKRKEMQKQQYVVQESDNSLYGRAAVSIKSVMVGREDDGHEYALYVIEVKRQAGEQMPAATWVVTRRYSQFHELHKRLRARFPSVRELDFPRRQALFTLQKDFVNKRRVTLERYLRSLLLVPAICRSRELRAFLSQSAITSNGNDAQVDAKDFVTRIYNSVSDGMEDFLGNIPVLDQLSVAGQNLISAASSQMNGASGTPAVIDHLDPAAQDPATSAEAEAELNAYETKEAEPFVKPICDLFLETFELSKGNSWLRGRTVVVVLHQLLGGTIERRVREAMKSATEDESLTRYVDLLKSTMWPDEKLHHTPAPRTPAEKTRLRQEASLILGALIPDMAGQVVGKANAQAASRKIIAMLNNQRLK